MVWGGSRGSPGGGREVPAKQFLQGAAGFRLGQKMYKNHTFCYGFYTFLHTRGKQIVTIFMISDSFHADNLQNAVGSVGEQAIELNFGPFDVSQTRPGCPQRPPACPRTPLHTWGEGGGNFCKAPPPPGSQLGSIPGR